MNVFLEQEQCTAMNEDMSWTTVWCEPASSVTQPQSGARPSDEGAPDGAWVF